MAQQKINQAQTDFKAGADALSAATLGTGVSVTDGYLTKIGNMVYLTGYFAKTSYSSGDTVLTLPTGYRPPNGMWRAACHGGGANLTGRVEVQSNGIVIVRNPSASMNGCIFSLVFPVA